MAKKQIFVVTTPLGYAVVLTRDRWREITRYKHPALKGHEKDVEECVRDPEIIRESTKDPDVHLYYRLLDGKYICVVVAGADADDRIVVTAYFAAHPKKGHDLWKK